MVDRKVLVIICLMLISLSVSNQFGARASSETLRVPQDYTTIQAAIDHAKPGDIIQVSSGTYHETLFINKNLTLLGEDKVNTIIVGNGTENSVIQANLTTVNISGFTIKNGTIGIMLETCKGSVIRDNNINETTRGIWLLRSNNNTVTDNLISESGWIGLVLCGRSSDNIVLRNTIKNKIIGIELTGRNNLIYHNNFINNQNQTEMLESFNNTWNNSLEGNYWSNYEGRDGDQDGIGDTPYLIDVNNQDNYPLMGMVSQFQVSNNEEIYYITTISNSTITDLKFGNSISLDVLPENTAGFCRISLPRVLFEVHQEILMNGLPPIMQKELSASNSTYVYLYFVYTATGQKIIIEPEFLVGIAASIFIFFIIVVAILVKKVRSKK